MRTVTQIFPQNAFINVIIKLFKTSNKTKNYEKSSQCLFKTRLEKYKIYSAAKNNLKLSIGTPYLLSSRTPFDYLLIYYTSQIFQYVNDNLKIRIWQFFLNFCIMYLTCPVSPYIKIF
jgi:hypothetical protein